MEGSRTSSMAPSWASLRLSTVWHELRQALDARPELASGATVVDAGGGSGGLAVPLAGLGHSVVVVDPSPDALASLERRAAESGVADRVTGYQGDLSSLSDFVPAGSADVLLCHAVLEVVDDPAEGLADGLTAVRSGGLVSILAANRHAVVVARALSGRFAAAEAALGDPDGRAGPTDRLLRRFGADELVALAEGAGLRVQSLSGVRVFTDLVASGAVDVDLEARHALERLELAAASEPAYRALATQLHLLAVRG
ncbi:MAG TPA: methyltransferase domain-containing protein [Frankiaceae bacterium]|nr:methyltransferase domain-containing protein [Frankiaceae bacterium]